MVRTARLATKHRGNRDAETSSQVPRGLRPTLGRVLRSPGAISRGPAGACGATGTPFLTVLVREDLQKNRRLGGKDQITIWTALLRSMLRRKRAHDATNLMLTPHDG